MAYYNDYTSIITYKTSVVISKAAISNAVANMLVSHAGATLITSATEGKASSATNYAEIKYANMYIRFYDTNTSSIYLGTLSYYIALTSNGKAITSGTIAMQYFSDVSCTVKMRFFNTASGFLCSYYNNDDAWTQFMFGLSCKKISTDAVVNVVGFGVPVSNGTVYTNDGPLVTNGAYYILNASYCAPVDVDGVKQEINKVQISTSASDNTKCRYYCDDVYIAATFLNTGNVVQIGTYYYNIYSSADCAVKILDA